MIAATGRVEDGSECDASEKYGEYYGAGTMFISEVQLESER